MKLFLLETSVSLAQRPILRHGPVSGIPMSSHEGLCLFHPKLMQYVVGSADHPGFVFLQSVSLHVTFFMVLFNWRKL